MPRNRPLEVIVARSAGTCFGVEAAIDMAEREKKPILGPLVHNPLVVANLAAAGIPILERYQDLDTLAGQVEEVVITAHGYPKQLKAALQERGITYHDATCPVLLKWVYSKIERFEEMGYTILLVGNPNHAEIIASRSYGTHIHVIYSEDDCDALPPISGPTVALCQTTIAREKFERLVDYLREHRFSDLKAVDTRCKPVKSQQEAVENLAQWVDAMLIVGGFESSNTTNLARISERYLPHRTYHIDSAASIDPAWFERVNNLGIGAGTSTPQHQIQQVERRLEELFPGQILIHRTARHDDEAEDASSEI
ncbi:MAG: 4-hydroxy-3-methylbut-2-enyl diphosphate reductase [Candidatus Wallbacteria bacterium]|nr:4-hydroxy-3-methylbut-2-enyl diphosphate reductase [Candidatus Wallbacteria bacterium]